MQRRTSRTLIYRDIAPSTASRLLTQKAALTPEMAVIGRSAEVWMKLQTAYSLAEAKKSVDSSRLHDLREKLSSLRSREENGNAYDGDEIYEEATHPLR